MSESLFGDIETAKRIERAEAANHVEYVTAMRVRKGGEQATAIDVGGGTAAFAGVGSPLTQAFGLGMDRPVPEAELDRLFEFYTSRGAEVAVEVCNLAHLSLANALVARGCRVEEHTHVLARRLRSVEPSERRDSVRPVGEEDLREWCDVVTRGFAEGAETPALRELLEVFHRQGNSECYSAWRGGRLVAGGSVFFVGEIAILGGTSTLAEHRGKGAQSDLVCHRLERAAARGAELAVVTTTPGTVSQRNALRAGFSILYARTKYVGPSAQQVRA
jgi:hypothetical protein